MADPSGAAAPPTEGERWARAELERLLAARFSPRALAHFLIASQRRAVDVRSRRPALGCQSMRWSAIGGALWAGLALLHIGPFRARLRDGLAWWGLTAVMLDWHLGMVETEDGHPRALGAADALTLARVWLAPAVLEAPTPALCAAGFATDVLDGRAARASQPTRAGRDLEGLADVCFAGALLLGLRRRGAIGRVASMAELARIGAGFAYALAVYFGRARPPAERLTHAARLTTPVRAGGMLAAAAGRRRLGTALVAAGCATSLGALGMALGQRAGRGAAPDELS